MKWIKFSKQKPEPHRQYLGKTPNGYTSFKYDGRDSCYDDNALMRDVIWWCEIEPPPVEIKPCPFCGQAEPKLSEDESYVKCPTCHADGPILSSVESHAQAIAAWNRRAG